MNRLDKFGPPSVNPYDRPVTVKNAKAPTEKQSIESPHRRPVTVVGSPGDASDLSVTASKELAAAKASAGAQGSAELGKVKDQAPKAPPVTPFGQRLRYGSFVVTADADRLTIEKGDDAAAKPITSLEKFVYRNSDGRALIVMLVTEAAGAPSRDPIDTTTPAPEAPPAADSGDEEKSEAPHE